MQWAAPWPASALTCSRAPIFASCSLRCWTATSLQESQDLLKAADAWESRKNSFGLTISLLPVLLILAIFVGCMLFGFSWIAGLIARF